MSISYSATNVFNQCATCQWWGGQRTVRNGIFRRSVEVEADTYGKCLSNDAIFSRHQQPANSGCSKWLKWNEIGE